MVNTYASFAFNQSLKKASGSACIFALNIEILKLTSDHQADHVVMRDLITSKVAGIISIAQSNHADSDLDNFSTELLRLVARYRGLGITESALAYSLREQAAKLEGI